MGFVLTSRDPELLLVLDEPSGRFRGPALPGAYRFGVRRADLSALPPLPRLFDSGGAWTLSRAAGGLRFDFFTPLHPEGPYRSAFVRDDLSGGEILLDRGYLGAARTADPIQFPLAELLVIQRLARRGAVELHACGLVDEAGRGILLAGRSGDGKTTTARLWAGSPGVTILSDDRIVLTKERGFRIHGTPWHGEGAFAANADAPLEAVFLLEHGHGELERVSGIAAVAELLPRSFPPFHDRAGMEAVLATLSDLAAEVPCWRFRFRPDAGAVAAVRSALGDRGR